MQTRAETRSAGQRAIRVAELRGTIAHLDEWTTMSVHMAVASGEQRWIERYEEAGPRLDAAIAEAVALATPEVSAQLGQTTEEAHRDLIAMQRAALRLAATGDRDAAKSLLNSPEFDYLKSVYAAGLDGFGRDLVVLSAARTSYLNNRASLEMAALALCVILLVAAISVFRGHARLRTVLVQTEQVAQTDALTGLPNRRQLQTTLDRAIAEAEHGAIVALMLLDLDRFKAVNDTLGHPVGDALLTAAAGRLRETVRHEDTVARLGGDEFAVLARCDAGVHDAVALSRRVLERLGEPFMIEGKSISVGVSIGIAFAPEHGTQSAPLFGRADLALYRAKEEGRNGFRIFDAAMDAVVAARQELELDLRGALARDEFILHYQPVVNLASGKTVCCEALLRWRHSAHGLVPPSQFIPLAEETRLIVEIGAWVLRRACRDAADWPNHVRVAVNVSAVQFQHLSLVPAVIDALQASGLAPERLELEVTETALIQDDVHLFATLESLRALGVRVALDDFGTGYSSLSYLRRFQFDRIKIDRSFVADIANRQTLAIMRAILALGSSLGVGLTAEGIETAEQLAAVEREGCTEAQGYLLGRPEPQEGLASHFSPIGLTARAA